MTTLHNDHAYELHRVNEIAKYCVLWFAVILLIKGHNDLKTDLLKCSLNLNHSQSESNTYTTVQMTVPTPKIEDWDGDLRVRGNIYIDGGCMLWQQPLGVYQNSCVIFTQTHQDCVHGIYDFIQSSCLCDDHWWGNLCNLHDCYGRGNFLLTTSTCKCTENYLSSTMCQSSIADKSSLCDATNCDGMCIIIESGESKCVCTKPGQLGLHCRQCASPLINSTLCPGRFDWGVHYISKIESKDNFAVCGGGYTISPDVLIIRGLKCTKPDCADFYDERIVCCNPLSLRGGFNFSTDCLNWQTFTYGIADFPDNGTVFNTGYQQRYAKIIETHSPYNIECEDSLLNSCLQRADFEIQSSDWPLLRINAFPNRGYTLKLGKFYLSAKAPKSYTHLVPALWTLNESFIYLHGSGKYYGNEYQLQHIFIYLSTGVYCLAKDRMDSKVHAMMFDGVFLSSYETWAYWINLKDQPGRVLPVSSYCGLFAVNVDDDGLVAIQENQQLYLGTTYMDQVYYSINMQRTVLN